MDLVKIVEALLFSYQEPLSTEHMVRAIRENAKDIVEAETEDSEAAKTLVMVTDEQVNEAVQKLIEHYQKDGHSFTIVERTHGWRLCASPDFADWCRSLYPGRKPQRLSQPALETLAIIAYRQPITKAGIEAVRGVSVDAMVQQLIDRGLVKVEGRAELPGKPLLYGTTEAFLDHFGIKTVDELPNSQELRRVQLPSEPTTTAEAPPPPQEVQLNLAPA